MDQGKVTLTEILSAQVIEILNQYKMHRKQWVGLMTTYTHLM